MMKRSSAPSFARIIRLEGYVVLEAENLKAAGRLLEKEDIDLVLCDVKLPDGNGVDFVKDIRARHPYVESILLTAYGNIADGVQAMKKRVHSTISPRAMTMIRSSPSWARAFERVQLQKRVVQLERRSANAIPSMRSSGLATHKRGPLFSPARSRLRMPTYSCSGDWHG